jgi:hypothetical protein
MAGSTDRISRRVSFCARLVGKPLSPPKMTLMTFLGSWKPCAPDLSPSSSSFSPPPATLEECVLGLQVHWALLVQDLLVLVQQVPRLLSVRVTLNSHNFIVWLALSRRS